jgi:serine/threonine-protein kinase PknG
MTACARPGCAGEIDSGYCNVCGYPPEPAGAPERPLVAAEGAPGADGGGADGGSCQRPGCGGTMDGGYCDWCGLAAVQGPEELLGVAADPAAPGPDVPASSSAAGAAPSANTASGSRGTSTVRRLSTSTATATAGRSVNATGSGGSRGNLGAGLVEIPSVPYRDPQSVLLVDPEVPERKRFCAHCDNPVGRSRGSRPARTEGFCPHDGKPYSFTPKLWPGNLVAGQYLVAGCIAHGGLGWIYLAQDKNVSDRWVVLKGLLDAGDESAMAAAIAERRFLAEVEHPKIVKIYNFVEHDDFGYIVMEYVGGESLREVRTRHREEEGSPLPVAQAIAYVLEILPAIGYLHHRGLLFCDFKPDNVIQTEEQLKLIDLGGVRGSDDAVSDLYGTVGYQAPEVPHTGASVVSDLYTVARTLAVLTVDFAGFQDEKRYAVRLPARKGVPAFQRYESFHRFLQKATATDPTTRFQSAGEIAEQLVGVLRQVVAIDGGSPVPAPSTLFSAELGAEPDALPWQQLPVPAVDPNDPASGVLATLALVGADQRQALLDTVARSAELSLFIARSAIDAGEFAAAARELDSEEARQSGWRAAWWRAVLSLAEGRGADAVSFFAAVDRELPGELAPKVALAACLEQAEGEDVSRELQHAARYYGLVAATDPGYASASFGLARVAMRLGDREEAVSALRRIPRSSSAWVDAQITLCRVQCAPLQGEMPQVGDLVATSDVLAGLALENSVRLPLVRDLHQHALTMLVEGRTPPDDGVQLMGAELAEHAQRAALERTFRSLAKLAPTDEDRYVLVDQANACRPRTLT